MQTSAKYLSTALHFNARRTLSAQQARPQAMVDTDGSGSIVNVSSRLSRPW